MVNGGARAKGRPEGSQDGPGGGQESTHRGTFAAELFIAAAGHGALPAAAAPRPSMRVAGAGCQRDP
eukprot:9500002-Pyramimonas_sp.AAC.1